MGENERRWEKMKENDSPVSVNIEWITAWEFCLKAYLKLQSLASALLNIRVQWNRTDEESCEQNTPFNESHAGFVNDLFPPHVLFSRVGQDTE